MGHYFLDTQYDTETTGSNKLSRLILLYIYFCIIFIVHTKDLIVKLCSHHLSFHLKMQIPRYYIWV